MGYAFIGDRSAVVAKAAVDDRLSWQARGMLFFIAATWPDVDTSIESLVAQTQNSRKRSGRDSVYAIVNELIEAGYLHRVKLRDEAGKFFNEYIEISWAQFFVDGGAQ